MEDIINKVCGQLITNPHVIGIILNCSECMNFSELSEYSDYYDGTNEIAEEDKKVDFCIISKEAGNQKMTYMENGYKVSLRWRTEVEFMHLIKNNKPSSNKKKVLYDKTGIINKHYRQESII